MSPSRLIRTLPLLAIALALCAGEPEGLRLAAAEAAGGQRGQDGAALFFAAAAGAGPAEARWDLSRPLPPGTWRVTIDFTTATGTATNLELVLVGPATIPVDCATLQPTASRSLVLANGAPLTAVSCRRTGQRNADTVGIRSIVIAPAPPPGPGDRCYLLCPVAGGEAALPWPLPAGMVHTRAAQALTLTWTAGGASFATPSANQTHLDLAAPATRIAVAGPSPCLVIERQPPAAVPAMETPSTTFIAATTDERETRTLVLPGVSSGTIDLATFPGGRRNAVFTTWDDGQLADLQAAELLAKHGFRGTFMMNHHSAMLPRLQELEALGMEIGSHSWSHPAFQLIGYARCRAETANMRLLLESRLGHPVISFAYPYGYQPAYDAQGDYVLRSVQEAGYWYARTTWGNAKLSIDAIDKPLLLATDAHFLTGPDRIAARFAERTATAGAVFEVWGHSYELAGRGAATLEAVLTAIGGRADTWYATGGEIFVWRWMRQNTVVAPGPQDARGLAFSLTRPWLHPHLRSVPTAVRVPAGIQRVIWNGKEIAVRDGIADLPWDAGR